MGLNDSDLKDFKVLGFTVQGFGLGLGVGHCPSGNEPNNFGMVSGPTTFRLLACESMGV